MLLNAKQEIEDGIVPYIKLVEAVPNKFIAKFRVPFGYTSTGSPYFYMTVKPEKTAVKLRLQWSKISSYTGEAGAGIVTATAAVGSADNLTAGAMYVLTTDAAATGCTNIGFDTENGAITAPTVDAGDMVVLLVEQVLEPDSADDKPLNIYDISWQVK